MPSAPANSPPRRGGVDAPREAQAQTGWSERQPSFRRTDHPGASRHPSSARRGILLLAGATLWCLGIAAAAVFHVSSVYYFFSAICHQDPARSWRLFGEPLPVCIRCASIYFAFAASLWLGIRANVRWLRISLLLMILEFGIARFVIDTAVLRSLSGILVGLAAAPFVKQGVEEIGDRL